MTDTAPAATRQKVEWIRQPDQISEDLQMRREQYGISYIAVFDEHSEAFAPVVARLAGT